MRWLQFIGAGTIGYFALIGFFILQDLRAEISFFLLILMWTTYVVLLIGFIFLFLFAREKYLGWKAERLEKQKQAEVQVVIARPDEQVHIRDTNHKAMWRNATTDPRIYANGHLTEPTQMELEQWRIARAKSVIPGNSVPLITTPLPEKIDLMEVLPSGVGSLNRIVLGVRVNEQGQVQTVSAPMYRLCHIAAAGATDSGKSNFGRAIAYQIATSHDQCQMVISDLKATSFKVFSNCDKLLYPVINSTGEFISVMNELVDEMSHRKELFKKYATVETLTDYNQKTENPLPIIVIFVDEVSNLFMLKQTQDVTLQMLREARAFGMYFLAMGQSWSHKEMNTSIRQQFRTGFHFGTNDPASSRMITNSSDAVKINVPGRALATLPFGMGQGAVEIQTPYIDMESVLNVLQPGLPIKDIPEYQEETNSWLTEKQSKVVDLWNQGIKDSYTLSKMVYGHVGQTQYDLVKRALEKGGIY